MVIIVDVQWTLSISRSKPFETQIGLESYCFSMNVRINLFLFFTKKDNLLQHLRKDSKLSCMFPTEKLLWPKTDEVFEFIVGRPTSSAGINFSSETTG